MRYKRKSRLNRHSLSMVENTLSGIGGMGYMFSNVNNVNVNNVNVNNVFYGSNVSSNANIINGVNNNSIISSSNNNSNINVKSSMVLMNLNNNNNNTNNNKFGLSGVSSTHFNKSNVGMHFNVNSNTPSTPQL